VSETVEYLKKYKAWRSGEDDRTMDEAGINPAELSAAINSAIDELEQHERLSVLHEATFTRVNARIGALTAENEHLSREMLTPDVFMRLIEWLREDPIKPASLAFTAGIARQVAYALEDEVVPMIKSARMIQSCIRPQPVFPLSSVELLIVEQERDHWKANHDTQVARSKVLMDRIDMPFERVNAYNDFAKYKTGYDRYEALRKLNVQQFAELYERNLSGERFDDMVDALVEP